MPESGFTLPYRLPAWVFVTISILVALGFRWVVTSNANLGAEDLERYEQLSGVDLPDFYADHPYFLLWTRGDGQAFATLAADPLLDGPSQRLLVADIRASRIGYSILGRLLAGGSVALIPIGLLLANVAAVALYASAVMSMVRRGSRHAWWLLANPAVLIGFASDTAEPAGLALALAAIVWSAAPTAGASAFLAGTVRPELVATFGVGRRALRPLLGGGLAVIGVQAYVMARLGPSFSSEMNIAFPPTGYFDAMPRLTPLGTVISLGVMVSAAATVVYGLRRRTGWARLSWLAYGLVILSLSASVIHSGVNVIRVAGGLPLLWLTPTWDTDRTDSLADTSITGRSPVKSTPK